MSTGNEPPTVALVAHAIHDGGGMERAFAELVKRAHSRVRFVVHAAELADDLRPLVVWHRVRVPLRPIPLKTVLFALVVGVRLARKRAQLVHTLGAIVPNRADVATIQFCTAGAVDATGRLTPAGSPPLRRVNTALTLSLSLAFERWCYRPTRLRRFAAVSNGVGAEVARFFPGIPVQLTPNGVDTDRYGPDARVRAEVRRGQGVGTDELVVLFVGGNWDYKGLAVAIEGVGVARDSGADLRLWVVGRGDRGRFAAIAREAGVQVDFFGARSDGQRFFQAADVFLLPTLYETFSLAAHEAAAAGLPIVATRVSGIDELVGDDEAGLLVERSAAAVAVALLRLAGEPLLRTSLGTEGRARVSALGWDDSVERVLDVYTGLLGVRP